MFRKLVVYVVLCFVICNVVNVKIHQVNNKGLVSSFAQKGNENDLVKICFENGKCTEMKYTARYLFPDQQAVLKGGVQMQKEISK